MIKYAKILDKKTGFCQVATGSNTPFYLEHGFIELDVLRSDVDGNWYLADKCPMLTEDEIKQKEREKLNMLSLTKREVFLALFKAKGTTPDEIKAQITDPEALIEFEYANEYFRGNPLIDMIGAKLGFSSEDLDYLFKNKELPEKKEEIPEETMEEKEDNSADEASASEDVNLNTSVTKNSKTRSSKV